MVLSVLIDTFYNLYKYCPSLTVIPFTYCTKQIEINNAKEIFGKKLASKICVQHCQKVFSAC